MAAARPAHRRGFLCGCRSRWVCALVRDRRSRQRSRRPSTGPRSRLEAAAGPEAASCSIRAVARRLGHQVYWAGPQVDTTYELTVSACWSTGVRAPPAERRADRRYPAIPADRDLSRFERVRAARQRADRLGEYGNGRSRMAWGSTPTANRTTATSRSRAATFRSASPPPCSTVAPKLVSSGAVVPVWRFRASRSRSRRAGRAGRSGRGSALPVGSS